MPRLIAELAEKRRHMAVHSLRRDLWVENLKWAQYAKTPSPHAHDDNPCARSRTASAGGAGLACHPRWAYLDEQPASASPPRAAESGRAIGRASTAGGTGPPPPKPLPAEASLALLPIRRSGIGSVRLGPGRSPTLV